MSEATDNLGPKNLNQQFLRSGEVMPLATVLDLIKYLSYCEQLQILEELGFEESQTDDTIEKMFKSGLAFIPVINPTTQKQKFYYKKLVSNETND